MGAQAAGLQQDSGHEVRAHHAGGSLFAKRGVRLHPGDVINLPAGNTPIDAYSVTPPWATTHDHRAGVSRMVTFDTPLKNDGDIGRSCHSVLLFQPVDESASQQGPWQDPPVVQKGAAGGEHRRSRASFSRSSSTWASLLAAITTEDVLPFILKKCASAPYGLEAVRRHRLRRHVRQKAVVRVRDEMTRLDRLHDSRPPPRSPFTPSTSAAHRPHPVGQDQPVGHHRGGH